MYMGKNASFFLYFGNWYKQVEHLEQYEQFEKREDGSPGSVEEGSKIGRLLHINGMPTT